MKDIETKAITTPMPTEAPIKNGTAVTYTGAPYTVTGSVLQGLHKPDGPRNPKTGEQPTKILYSWHYFLTPEGQIPNPMIQGFVAETQIQVAK